MNWKNSACMQSRLKPNAKGYVCLVINGKSIKAHQVIYRLFVGSVGKGQEIDHLCRNRKCINPAHLEAVSKKENILRGQSFAAKNKRKTHCAKGHEYSGENLIQKKHRRVCRKCSNEDTRNYKRKARKLGKADWVKRENAACPLSRELAETAKLTEKQK